MFFKRYAGISSLLFFMLIFPGCCTGEKVITKPSGLKYIDNKIGTGKEAERGDTVTIHFMAWLVGDPSGVFNDQANDSSMICLGNSYTSKEPLEFILQENNFIKGSEQGIEGMKEGGIRTVIIPAQLYGGAKDKSIIPGSNIKLIVELLHSK